MSDILCIYYSPDGHTNRWRRVSPENSGAELVELRDNVDRSGARGWLRCGLDAMRRTTRPLLPFQTEKGLKGYKLVIVASPVWAGRCSSVIRGFLKQHGKKLPHAAYVLTRSSEERSEEVFEQMDLYTPCGHVAAVSLRLGVLWAMPLAGGVPPPGAGVPGPGMTDTAAKRGRWPVLEKWKALAVRYEDLEAQLGTPAFRVTRKSCGR